MDMKVIDRINKLLALAKDSGATEAEALLAMEKAQAIMDEHNLTMAELGSGEGGQRSKEGFDGQAMFEYQRNMMAVIAEVNYCYVAVLYSYKTRGRRAIGYRLIGQQANVASTRVMFEYLANTIDRLVRDFNGGDYKLRMSRSSISWCAGCAERLCERIKERHENFIAEQKKEADAKKRAAQHPASPSHGALVVVMEDYAQKERDLNNDFKHGWEPGTTERERLSRELRHKEQREKKIAKALAAGFDNRVAEAFAEYYFESLQEAYDWVHGVQKPMTEEERRKAEKEEERMRRRWRNEHNREMAKKDWNAYGKGKEAGAKISLNPQVSKGSSSEAKKIR